MINDGARWYTDFVAHQDALTWGLSGGAKALLISACGCGALGRNGGTWRLDCAKCCAVMTAPAPLADRTWHLRLGVSHA